MIDFALLPPEVNSARMYAGPGSGPMLAAATAWDVIADEFATTAAFFEMTVVDLATGPWRGPTSMAMSAAALPFATWLKATAAQAMQAGSQAKALAAAYEAAFLLTVPPPLIEANRALLTLLVGTNFFGQNTPAIAATEAHYAAMWAQDATAMYGYAGSSQAAMKVSPFTPPPSTTSPTGLAGQAAAVAQSAAAEAGSSATAPAVPGASGSVLAGAQAMLDQVTALNGLTTSGLSPATLISSIAQGMNSLEDTPNAYMNPRDVLAAATQAAGAAAKPTVAPAAFIPGGGATPALAVGQATRLGGLSVPSSWPTAPTGQAQATLAAARSAAATALADAETAGAARMGMGMGLPGMPGRAAASGAHQMRFVPRYGYRHQMVLRPPSGG